MKQLARAYNLLTHKSQVRCLTLHPQQATRVQMQIAVLLPSFSNALLLDVRQPIQLSKHAFFLSMLQGYPWKRAHALRCDGIQAWEKKAAGRPLPKTLALRPREACKTAPNKACRYHIASKSLTARIYGTQTTTLRNSPRRPKSKAAWRP